MSDLVFSFIVYFLFMVVVITGIRKNGNKNIHDMLTKYNSLRGIFAIEVLLGHVVQYESGTLLKPLSLFMLVSVGFFFFISAFGMCVSFHDREKYLDRHFLLRKCGYLLLIAIIVYFFSWVVTIFTGCYIWKFNSILEMILGFPERTNWYIWGLMLFYVLFYVVYRFISKASLRCLLITAISFITMTILYYFDVQERYYVSTLCFPLGIIMGEYYEQFCNFLLSLKGMVISVILTLVGLWPLLFSRGIFTLCYSKNICCISIILILFIFLSKFEIKNKVILFLMKLSTEIYLCSFLWIHTLELTGMNYMQRMPIILLATILSALMINPICFAIKKQLK